MHPADIKAALEKQGATQIAIARSLRGLNGQSISRMAVAHVIKGTSKSARIARRISEVTGIPVGQLWPGKYPDIEKLDRIGLDPKSSPAAALLKQLTSRRGR